MKGKNKTVFYIILALLLLAVFCLYNTASNQRKIVGEWVSEEKVCLQFSADGIWKSEDSVQTYAGLWKYGLGKFTAEDLSGKTFEFNIENDETGVYIILENEQYYKYNYY